MKLADVNVLVAAFRSDHVHHDHCRGWLLGALAAPDGLAVSLLSLAALVRITTNGRIFKSPDTIDDAFAFCGRLLRQSGCRPIAPAERHWGIFEQLCRAVSVKGGDTTDAWLAALAIEWNCELVTLDGDFARFPGLRWLSPR